MGGCCYACLKYLVMVFNLVYMLLGLALQGCMLWIYFDDAIIAPIAKDVEGYNWLIFILMGVGTVITIMGFLGCCGALQESQCMLSTFFALVLVLFAGQVAIVIMIYQRTPQFKDITVSEFRKSLQENYSFHPSKTEAMDVMQRDLRCCGSGGPNDWKNAKFNKPKDEKDEFDIGIASTQSHFEIPASCCKANFEACDTARRQVKGTGQLMELFHKEGCANKVIAVIEENKAVLYISLFVVAFIEILAMIFSMVLCCTARRIDQYKA